MKNKRQFPAEYTPFDEIILCSNKLNRVQAIIDDNGFFPILIGENKENKKPEIWLNTKTKEGILKLIDKNTSLINLIEINEHLNEDRIDVILNDQGKKQILLQIENFGILPTITKFDLRPIGYNIHGDEKVLCIGTNEMSNSSFHAETLFAFSK